MHPAPPPSPPDPDDPRAVGAWTQGSVAPESVFEEVRRTAARPSLGRAILLRAVGLLVLVGATWIIARNVSWTDTLRIERAGGAALTIEGSIVGDWREPAVEFRPRAEAALDADELAALAAFDAELAAATSESLGTGRALRASVDEVSLFGGRALARRAAADGALPAARIEWRPGMLRTLREIDVARLLPALLFLVLASLTVVTRWWRLLALNDCATSWYDAFRFTYSGLFFNAVIPGINGGDVARAVAVVREHPDRRSDAFMTVVVDRAIGLVGMVLVGTALVLASDERLDALKWPVGLFAGALVVSLLLFFNGAVRRLVRFEAVALRLPQGERLLRLDAGARRLVQHPGEVALAMLLSFGNHVFNGLAVYTAALALGTTLGFPDWLATMAIANTLAAVPISPGGLGVGEVLFGSLAELLGSTYAIGVATSLLYRLALYTMSLIGGLVMLLPGGGSRVAPANLRAGDGDSAPA